MSDPIVIVDYARTPMGAFQGALSSLSVSELGAVAIKAAVARSGISSTEIDTALMGCVLPAGAGQAPARQAVLGAGLPQSVTCTTVNKVCGSGMKSVMMGCAELSAGNAVVVVAGGMESMSNAPYMLAKARSGYRIGHGELVDHMFFDGLQDAYSGGLMGGFGERCASHYGFTREQQDNYAIESLRRANEAINLGKFDREIAPVTLTSLRVESIVNVDEQPGKAVPEKIPTLRPAFSKEGTITAANASSISDGAAALVLMRHSEAVARGLKPVAVVCGSSEFAHQPEWFSTAPVSAIKKLLQKLCWSADEVDLYEVNEAFAVVTMAAMSDLNIPHERINVHGGACALGHPLGASGARIIVTLLAALEFYGKKKGVASLCIGGGEATAIAVEML